MPSTDKAVILARGLGTRMRRSDGSAALDPRQASLADQGMKALIPIGRPFLDYVLSGLAEAGYRRVCLIVGPEHDALREYYGGQLRPKRLRIEFAVQQEPRGTADAVAAGESFADGDDVLAINSDNYYPVEALRALGDQDGSAVALFEREAMFAGSNVPPERLRQFAVARIGEDDCLERIVEKPGEELLAEWPRPLWVSMNCWRFGPAIFEACRRISPSPRGEYEIPDAVEYAMHQLGEPFRAVRVHGAVLDLSSRQDVASIAPRLAGVKVDL